MKTIIFAILLSTPPSVSQATVIVPADVKCPIGGEVFRSFKIKSSSSFGRHLDLQPKSSAGDKLFPIECPSNGFVIFGDKFTDDQTRILEDHLSSEEYQAMRSVETKSYRAYTLMKKLKYSEEDLAHMLLKATWEAGFFQYRRYAKEALTHFTRLSESLKADQSPKAFWSMHIRGELNRRLLNFWNAREVFEFQLGRPGIHGNPYEKLAHQELTLIRRFRFDSVLVNY